MISYRCHLTHHAYRCRYARHAITLSLLLNKGSRLNPNSKSFTRHIMTVAKSVRTLSTWISIYGEETCTATITSRTPASNPCKSSRMHEAELANLPSTRFATTASTSRDGAKPARVYHTRLSLPALPWSLLQVPWLLQEFLVRVQVVGVAGKQYRTTNQTTLVTFMLIHLLLTRTNFGSV